MKGMILVCRQCEENGHFHDISDQSNRYGPGFHHCSRINGVTGGEWIKETEKREKAREISLDHWKKRKEIVSRLIAEVAPDRSVLERDMLREIGA